MFNVWLSGLNKCSAHESVKLGAKEIDVTSKGLNNVYCESLRITADQTKSSLHPFNQCLRAQPRQEPKSAFDDNVNRRLCTVKFFCNVSLFAWSLITQETAQETNHFNLIIKMSSSWQFLLISPRGLGFKHWYACHSLCVSFSLFFCEEIIYDRVITQRAQIMQRKSHDR